MNLKLSIKPDTLSKKLAAGIGARVLAREDRVAQESHFGGKIP